MTMILPDEHFPAVLHSTWPLQPACPLSDAPVNTLGRTPPTKPLLQGSPPISLPHLKAVFHPPATAPDSRFHLTPVQNTFANFQRSPSVVLHMGQKDSTQYVITIRPV
ncbi:hypothetical protein ATANTOWER_015785 [Ataeniobius toweri]|uniref:Uncharacterized protein n=1 Tax=Ataeniobius toweri TaxID=208326 RepID=A0ABU7BIX4_9TELE|nr:hypothetical protein [Ataeniobius toweri]